MFDGFIIKTVAYQNITYSCSAKKQKKNNQKGSKFSEGKLVCTLMMYKLTKLFVYVVVFHRKGDFLLLYEQLGLVL